MAPIRRISGSINTEPATVSKAPSASARKKPVLATQTALSSSRAPRCKDTMVPDPIPKVKPIA